MRASEVAGAIARGLARAGWEADLCPLEAVGSGAELAAALDEVRFDERMRASRAVVLGQGTLRREDLRTALGELATRARQAGVPAHAIVGANRIDLFDQRILDLQHVLEAPTAAAVEAAAEALAGRL
ncbi:MAG TPA: hypothetical protein VHB30_12780 [Solirubrobacteraceae bacterium]|nr:hypothetical protein [Solirubrobacteraceae bacterium]